MGVPARQRFTFDEYLLLEEIAEVKHEFLDGEVWAMAGGSPEHAAINPRAIVEVPSPSTEDYDRGEKLSHYQTIPSLEEIVLVAHDRQEIEVVRREADGTWSRHVAGVGQSAYLTSIACELSVAEAYRDPLAGD